MNLGISWRISWTPMDFVAGILWTPMLLWILMESWTPMFKALWTITLFMDTHYIGNIWTPMEYDWNFVEISWTPTEFRGHPPDVKIFESRILLN